MEVIIPNFCSVFLCIIKQSFLNTSQHNLDLLRQNYMCNLPFLCWCVLCLCSENNNIFFKKIQSI